ncbi:MAG: hypothetical protein M5U22_15660 [Thermoleophilia bacterium]|nr:hypothetical protein [Thermoleophilia bacterium]
MTNSVAYAQACESALGLRPTPEIARARTLLLELERLYNHLSDIGAACAGVGFALGNMAFASLKERTQRLNARLAGHRFLFGTIGVDARKAWREVLFNASVQDRFVGGGRLSAEVAREMGTVGPAARAMWVGDLGAVHDVVSVDLRIPGCPPSPDVTARHLLQALDLRAKRHLPEQG